MVTDTLKKRRKRTNETEEATVSSTQSLVMKINKSKYMILALSLMCFSLCFFPMQSGRFTDGEACMMVINGYNLWSLAR